MIDKQITSVIILKTFKVSLIYELVILTSLDYFAQQFLIQAQIKFAMVALLDIWTCR